MQNYLNILGLPGDKGPELKACSAYRVVWPLRALQRAGLGDFFVPPSVDGQRTVMLNDDGRTDPMEPSLVNNYDLIVLQRQPDKDVGELIRVCKRAGIKTVFDIDDSVLTITPKNPNYVVWGRDLRKVRQLAVSYIRSGDVPEIIRGKNPDQVAEQAKTIRAGLLRNIRSADLLTVTTPSLKDEYSMHNGNIVVLPNQMDTERWDNLDAPEHPGRIWLTWAGGWTHRDDLALIKQTVKHVINRYPNVDLCLVGFDQAKEIVFGEIPSDRVVTFPWTPGVYTYRKYLAGADIILAPSESTKFNESKSDIRIMEGWLAARAPAVASRTTYGATIRESGGGYTAKNTRQWIQTLCRLIENEDLRKQMGQRGYDYVVSKRTYDVNVGLWYDAYSSLF